MRTLYRSFKDDDRLDVTTLPMKGKRKENGHQEKRGKQAFRRTINDREEAWFFVKYWGINFFKTTNLSTI